MSTKSRVTYVNADGLIVGRMSSKIAKRLLDGEQVIILNAEKAVYSGKRKSQIAEAHIFLEVGAPERGPFHYRRPDRMLKKTVRGMLPCNQPKGKTAFKRLKVFMGVPLEFKDQQVIQFEDAQASKLKGPSLTLGELAKEIGWNQGE
ncbi:MAG: 50S ribosomal protein L13 [Nitrososphaerota archaeon]|jgi:large subunit ribosomal protein L13|uniref:50S ribosomal protein L13 n=1 Tax=Candidatus Bathycorpusculum sp. TaxID=2994959 RepID=UPI00281A3872|nr:50S ribosomal protein L13 [Candidatus Termiticorpusculum sp.]MCL2256955.1 50S ribosomal protein L13 [Candidatus Termiticorpusculum sp.]MCL2292921.1 50S ribosomal protein L13 [Candidatus Termiticorpusculum sp.]MDR0460973.1 50S ribosomal protein L13 [Nitrososphaerota archaeon]